MSQDEEVDDTFHDGILCLTLSQDPGDPTARIEDLIYNFTGARPGFADAGAPTAGLARILDGRNAQLVIDDVWDARHLQTLIQASPGYKHLVTTRATGVAPTDAMRIPVPRMSPGGGASARLVVAARWRQIALARALTWTLAIIVATHQRHSSNGYVSPLDFEKDYVPLHLTA